LGDGGRSLVSIATTPLAVESGELRNTTDLLERRLRIAPDHVAFARRTSARLENVTTREFHDEVRRHRRRVWSPRASGSATAS
jgi:hypothetical protein